MSNRQTFSQSDIESFHWLRFNGQNGEVLYTLSGVINVNMTGSSQDWLQMDVTCAIDIPVLPAGQGLYIIYHTSFAALNSIYNRGNAVNGGHAVNNFDLVSVNPDLNHGSNKVTLALKLAVSDSDAILYRVGFNITLTGTFKPLVPVDPCKAEADKLTQLQALCNGGYENLIAEAQNELQHASASQKPAIRQRIANLEASLRSCPVTLKAAQDALSRCRTSHPENK